ncbi:MULTISPECIES: transcriptional regulator [Pseudomonas]|uniref:transcriptional regulator n=1 Tax=Pseudomonas TaxID=286 RepID=UPI000A1F6E18|nr:MULTISPECIES: transcriptional regulator [unclassified Pseudomonas]POA49971.1 transcriptional regulator [Pseudomonas sp. FW507-12TSA]
MSRRLFCVAVLAAGCAFAAQAQEVQTQEAQAQEPLPSVEQVMSDHKEKINNQIETINYKRKRVVEANMGLDSGQAETFWPIYGRYRNELDSLNRNSFELLLEYARAYGSGAVSNQDAAKMIKVYKALQVKRQMLLSRYIDEVSEKMSSVTAMRFLQIEEQLDAVEMLETGQRIPLVGTTSNRL